MYTKTCEKYILHASCLWKSKCLMKLPNAGPFGKTNMFVLFRCNMVQCFHYTSKIKKSGEKSLLSFQDL